MSVSLTRKVCIYLPLTVCVCLSVCLVSHCLSISVCLSICLSLFLSNLLILSVQDYFPKYKRVSYLKLYLLETCSWFYASCRTILYLVFCLCLCLMVPRVSVLAEISLEALEQECHWVQAELERVGIPVCLSHNDVWAANILYNTHTGTDEYDSVHVGLHNGARVIYDGV